MDTSKKILIAGTAFATAALPTVGCTAPESPSASAGSSTGAAPFDPAVQSALDALIEAGATAGVIDIRDGDEQLAGAAGSVGIDDDTPAQVGDQLRIASITKSVTATVVMQLVEEGALTLDTTVGEVVPGLLPAAPGPVTVRQLLGHTSGLPEYIDVIVPDGEAVLTEQTAATEYAPEELLAVAQSRPWVSAPGSAFSYSNGNYVVLGLIAEAVTGDPLPRLMTERVFEPLGMDDTEYPETAVLPEGALRADLEIGGELVDVSDTSPSLWSSGAALTSTVGDVGTFFQGLFGGELVSAESVAAMQHIGVEGYGLGLLAGGDACGAQPAELVYGQRGNGFGYRVMAIGSPDGERFVTVGWTGGTFDPATDELIVPGNDLLVTALASTC